MFLRWCSILCLVLVCAATIIPSQLVADEIAIFGGLSVQSSESGAEVFPVLVIEAGCLTFGLDQTTVLIAETDDYDLLAGISYELDGEFAVFLNGIAYTPFGLNIEAEVGKTLGEGDLFASTEFATPLEVGHAAFAPSFGWQLDEASDQAADPFISLSAFVPVSQSAAILGELTAVGVSGSFDYSVSLVKEF